jgi:hypothetical protein
LCISGDEIQVFLMFPLSEHLLNGGRGSLSQERSQGFLWSCHVPPKGNRHQSMPLWIDVNHENTIRRTLLVAQLDRKTSGEIDCRSGFSHSTLLICYSYHKRHVDSPIFHDNLHKFRPKHWKLA